MGFMCICHVQASQFALETVRTKRISEFYDCYKNEYAVKFAQNKKKEILQKQTNKESCTCHWKSVVYWKYDDDKKIAT